MTKGATVSDKRGNTYNIDVFFEFDIASVRHRVAIECKDHKRPTTRDEVIAFHGKISDMPSAIGVFVSMTGFQSGAKVYLDDHGIEYYDGDTLPNFRSIVESWLQPVALPDDAAIGQPFWTVMAAKDGSSTGAWHLVPIDGADAPGRNYEHAAVPLFMSKAEALRYQKVAHIDDGSSCVRGLEQPALRAVIGLAELEGLRFATMTPFEEKGQSRYLCEAWTPQQLADEFVVVGDTPGVPGRRV